MELYAKINSGFKPLAIFAERSTLNIRLGPKYASDGNHLLFLEIKEIYKVSWVKI